jgi:hypothetical protein
VSVDGGDVDGNSWRTAEFAKPKEEIIQHFKNAFILFYSFTHVLEHYGID